MNKKELIRQAIGFQKEIDRLIMYFKIEEWLSLDLTIAQLKSVIYIYQKRKASYKELAEALNVTPSVVTGIVDRLVIQGMVKRKVGDKSADRRVQWLVVTDKGKALLDNIRQQMHVNMEQILETMSIEDLSAMIKGFSSLIKAAGTFLKNSSKPAGIAANQEEF